LLFQNFINTEYFLSKYALILPLNTIVVFKDIQEFYSPNYFYFATFQEKHQ